MPRVPDRARHRPLPPAVLPPSRGGALRVSAITEPSHGWRRSRCLLTMQGLSDPGEFVLNEPSRRLQAPPWPRVKHTTDRRGSSRPVG